jgi:positive phototaxis protein PixI
MQTPTIARANPTERLQQLLPELFNPKQQTGESFLRLQISPDLTVAIALDWVEETRLVMAQDLTPIPNMPPYILGLINTKGQVFWLASLAQRFGISSLRENTQRYEVVVIRAFAGADQQEELLLGLTVQQIKSSIRLETKDITPIEASTAQFPPNLLPFLIGHTSKNNESLLILNPDTLAKSSP